MTPKLLASYPRACVPIIAGLALASCLGVLGGCRSTSSGLKGPLVSKAPTASAADITAQRLQRREQVRRDIGQRYADALSADAATLSSSRVGGSISGPSSVLPTAAEIPAERQRGELADNAAPWEESLREVIDDIAGGDDPAALVRLEDLLGRHGRDPIMVHAAAVQLLRVNRPDIVVDKIAPVLRELPPDARLDQVLGLALYRLGRFSEAETVLLRSLELDNTLPLTYLFLGCTAEKLHQPQQARRYFERASQLGL